LNKGRIMKGSEADLYTMPALDEGQVAMKKVGDIQRNAYAEGFASGENAGFTAGEQKALVLTDRLQKIIEELTVFKERMIREAEAQVVDLSVAIAAKILVGEINTKPELIISMVREGLKRLQRGGPITIRINPALYDLFTAKKPELTEVHEDITFDVNPNVPVAGPLVISQTQEMVTDVEALIVNILKEIRKVDTSKTPALRQEAEEDGSLNTPVPEQDADESVPEDPE
jgi:hypothetical protein